MLLSLKDMPFMLLMNVDIEMKPYHPSKEIVSNYLQNWYRYKPNEAIKASET